MAKKYPGKAAAQRRRWADPAYRERWIAGAKARWADPAYRAKMAAAGFKPVTAADHQRTPGKWSRLGIPTGYTRETAAVAWEKAEHEADEVMTVLEAAGIIPATVIPDTEEALVCASDEVLAKAAIRGLYVLAIGPSTDRHRKLQALSTILAFTKAKPAERRAIMKANNPTDEWLRSLPLDEIFPQPLNETN